MHRKKDTEINVTHYSIKVRNPYIDPINLVQVELLRRLRDTGEDERLRDALLMTINGTAAGTPIRDSERLVPLDRLGLPSL